MTADLHHLAAAYALDALEADERAAFEAHLPGCERCRAELATFADTAASLADAVAVAPPPDLKRRVLDEVAVTPQVSAPSTRPVDGAGPSVVELATRRRVSAGRFLAAAAALVAIAVGAVVVIAARDGDGDQVADLVAAADAVVTTLEGDVGTVRVVWSPERDQVALLATDLPAPGDDLVYELWAIDGEPVPAGLFRPVGGEVRQIADDVDLGDVEPAAWGITIEPAGGSEAPTSEILYYGESTT